MQHTKIVETIEIPMIQLKVLKMGIEMEINNGMQLTRGPSASARAKEILRLPKGWRKKRVLKAIEDILAQVQD